MIQVFAFLCTPGHAEHEHSVTTLSATALYLAYVNFTKKDVSSWYLQTFLEGTLTVFTPYHTFLGFLPYLPSHMFFHMAPLSFQL